MNFVLIGSAGYIAERHMKAIKDTGNNLICAYDTFDVMGRIDKYFPQAEFLSKINELESFLSNNKVDYVVICVPNDLHLFFTKLALAYDINVICEKPLTLSPKDLDDMEEAEKNSNGTVNTILQLRHHPAIIAIKESVETNHKVKLDYITSRGKWYHKSWKGNIIRSGGVLMNIGVHFFDMLLWVFGDVRYIRTYMLEEDKAAGRLILDKAEVEWMLSLDYKDLPVDATGNTFRSIQIDGEEIIFTNGFTDLHTTSYQNILRGRGYGIKEARKSIELINKIR